MSSASSRACSKRPSKICAGSDWTGTANRTCNRSGAADIDAAAQSLLARALAYPCTCTRKEILTAVAAPHGGEANSIYPGTCRGKYKSLAAAEQASGRPAALRFVVPDIIVRIEDGIQGVREYDARATLGDFPISRRVGMPAYQLAVVVDDARQGVTEIVRGADLLESCARQWLLQEALGYSHPRWWHVLLGHRRVGPPPRQAQRRYFPRPTARRRRRPTPDRFLGSSLRGHRRATAHPRPRADRSLRHRPVAALRCPRHADGSERIRPRLN